MVDEARRLVPGMTGPHHGQHDKARCPSQPNAEPPPMFRAFRNVRVRDRPDGAVGRTWSPLEASLPVDHHSPEPRTIL